MPLPLTVSCSSKIQIGFTFLVPAYPGCPGKEAVKWLLLLLFNFCLLIFFQLCCATTYDGEIKLYIITLETRQSYILTSPLARRMRRVAISMFVCLSARLF